MNKDIEKLARIACKLDRKYEAEGTKWLTKRRILKRAVSVQKKMIQEIRKIMPVNSTPEERMEKLQEILQWMQTRLKKRIGRTPKNPVPRKERRLIARQEAKEAAKRLP